jgi:hypothetical protein
MAVIKSSDVTQEKFLESQIESLENFNALLIKTEGIIKGLGEQFSTSLKSLDVSKVGDQKKLEQILQAEIKLEKELIEVQRKKGQVEKEIAKLEQEREKARKLKLQNDKTEIDNAKKLKKAEEQEIKRKKQKEKLTDEELKNKIQQQKEDRQRRKNLQAELTLEKEVIKSKGELKEQISALKVVADGLDLGSDELKEVNDRIDELTDSLRENSSVDQQRILNIGNYKSATEGLTDSFEDQKKKLDILEKAYLNATSQGAKSGKEFRKLRRELRQQTRTVKELGEGLEETKNKQNTLQKGFKGLGATIKAAGIGFLLGLFANLGDAFATSRKTSADFRKEIANFTETIKVFFRALINSFDGFKDVLQASINSFKSFFLDIQKGFLTTQVSISKAIDSVAEFFGKTTDATKQYQSALDEVNKKQEDLGNVSELAAQGVSKISKAFEDIGKTTREAIDLAQEFIDLQLQTEISIERQTRQLAGLAIQRQRLQDISDDDTLGFLTREKAVEKAREAAEEFARRETKLARDKERLTIEGIKIELARANAVEIADLRAITTGEQLNALLRDRALALEISSQAEQEFTQAFAERREKEADQEAFSRDQAEKNRKTARDDFEQRQDIIEEFSEFNFALNEKIATSDRSTQEQRRKAYEDNQRIIQSLSERSLLNIQDQARKSIDLNEDLSDSEKKVAKEKINAIDLNEILNAQNEIEIQQIIRRADLGEIEEKRLKESVKLRGELLEANKELNTEIQESDIENLELRKELDLQQQALESKEKDRFEKLENDRKELEKENLRNRINDLTEFSNERLNLEIQLNELLLEEKKEANEKQKEEDKKYLDERKKQLNDFVTFSEKVADQIFAQRIKAIDDEASAVTQRQSELNAQVQAGNEDANDSLTELNKRQRELELQRQKEIAQQKRVEFALAAVKAYSSNLDSQDPNNALTSTLTDINVLIAAIGSLQGFYKGTTRVEKDMGQPHIPWVKNDKYIARLDGGERVIPTFLNDLIPANMSNKELVNALHDNVLANSPIHSSTMKSQGAQTVVVKNNIDPYAMGAEIGRNIPRQSVQAHEQVGFIRVVNEEYKKRDELVVRAKNLIS